MAHYQVTLQGIQWDDVVDGERVDTLELPRERVVVVRTDSEWRAVSVALDKLSDEFGFLIVDVARVRTFRVDRNYLVRFDGVQWQYDWNDRLPSSEQRVVEAANADEAYDVLREELEHEFGDVICGVAMRTVELAP